MKGALMIYFYRYSNKIIHPENVSAFSNFAFLLQREVFLHTNATFLFRRSFVDSESEIFENIDMYKHLFMLCPHTDWPTGAYFEWQFKKPHFSPQTSKGHLFLPFLDIIYLSITQLLGII